MSDEDIPRLQRLATLGELSAEMAHEVCQPLAAIRNFAEVGLQHLKDDPQDTAKIEQVLATIFIQAGQAQKIASRTTSYAHQTNMDRARIHLGDVIEQVLRLIKYEAKHQSVKLTHQINDDLPNVDANSLELQQVFVNLVRNAIEAAAAAPHDDAKVSVEGRCENNKVIVEVRDNGTGIEKENLESVFDRYFSTKEHGVGLGLFVTRSIVESHDGRIWVTPNEDQGTTFHVELPVATLPKVAPSG